MADNVKISYFLSSPIPSYGTANIANITAAASPSPSTEGKESQHKPMSTNDWLQATAAGQFIGEFGGDFKVCEKEEVKEPWGLNKLKWKKVGDAKDGVEVAQQWIAQLIPTYNPQLKDKTEELAKNVWSAIEEAKTTDLAALEKEKKEAEDKSQDTYYEYKYQQHLKEIEGQTKLYNVEKRKAKAKVEVKRRNKITLWVFSGLFVALSFVMLMVNLFSSNAPTSLSGTLYQLFISPYTSSIASGVILGLATFIWLIALIASAVGYFSHSLTDKEETDKEETDLKLEEKDTDPHAVLVRYLRLAIKKIDDEINGENGLNDAIEQEETAIEEAKDDAAKETLQKKLKEKKDEKKQKEKFQKLLKYIYTREYVYITNRRKLLESDIELIKNAPAFHALPAEKEKAATSYHIDQLQKDFLAIKDALPSTSTSTPQEQQAELKDKENDLSFKLYEYGIYYNYTDNQFHDCLRPLGLTDAEYNNYSIQLAIKEGRFRMTDAMLHPEKRLWHLARFNWSAATFGKTLDRETALKLAVSRDNDTPTKTDNDKFRAQYSFWSMTRIKQDVFGTILIGCKVIAGSMLCFAFLSLTGWFHDWWGYLLMAFAAFVCNAFAALFSRALSMHKATGSTPEEARTDSKNQKPGKKKGSAHWVKLAYVGLIVPLACVAAGLTAWYALTNEHGLSSLFGSSIVSTPWGLAICSLVTFATAISFYSFQANNIAPSINKFFDTFKDQYSSAYNETKAANPDSTLLPVIAGAWRFTWTTFLALLIAGVASLLAWFTISSGVASLLGAGFSAGIYIAGAATATTVFVTLFSQVHKVVELYTSSGKMIKDAKSKLKGRSKLLLVFLFVAFLGDIAAYSVAGGWSTGSDRFGDGKNGWALAAWLKYSLIGLTILVLAAMAFAFTWVNSFAEDNLKKIRKKLGIEPKYKTDEVKERKDIIDQLQSKTQAEVKGKTDTVVAPSRVATEVPEISPRTTLSQSLVSETGSATPRTPMLSPTSNTQERANLPSSTSTITNNLSDQAKKN